MSTTFHRLLTTVDHSNIEQAFGGTTGPDCSDAPSSKESGRTESPLILELGIISNYQQA
ncbi:hypothetical protein E4U32_004366 [Claviceps aff. humidiphila group G2b]|nr:hypothetical protein E4U32_004366 [Claviceps aff. humidiphila group G2b]